MGYDRFQGQTKTKLGNPEVRAVVEQVIMEEVGDFLQSNPEVFQDLFEKVGSVVIYICDICSICVFV